MQGEKPVLSEEGIGPAPMIARRATYLLEPRYPGPPTYDPSTPTLLPMTTRVDHPGLALV